MNKPPTRGSTNPSSTRSSSKSSTLEDRREDKSCSEETEQQEANRQGANQQGTNRREADRLAALHRYGVLDTEDEAAFDRITQLVQQLLEVPIALVTLVDKERQWFKSCTGMEQPGREQPGREERGIPREVTFCNHNIRSEEVMVVEDATADPRFADNPLVTGPPHIRFYAGAPLVTEDGYALGSLCVIDTEPRSLAAGERATLETLAAVVVDAMTMQTHYAREHEILESMGDGFIALDTDWRLTYVNKQAEDALRHSREDLLGQSLWEMFPEAKGTIFDETLHQVAETGEAAEFEAYFSPIQTWFRVKARPVEQGSSKDPSQGSSRGSSRGLSVYFDDITQQKENQKQLRRLGQAMEDMKEAVVITDNQLDSPGPHIEYVNPAFTEMTGYTEDEVLGQTPRLFQGPKTDRATLDHIRKRLDAGEPVEAEAINYHKDGTTHRLQWTISPVRGEDGTIQHWVAVQRDVTEEVETRQQLIDAKEEAESASRLKSAMLANMSHEVRTPLTSIIGFAEVLADELSGTHRQFVDQIYQSGQRLELTLTSVLQLSKLEADLEALHVEAFDVAGELDEAARAIALEAQEADVDIQVYASERPMRIVSDRNAFYRIMMNLACNAVKFTEAGGRVELRVTREGNQVILRVQDTGVGISDAFQAQMFEAFTQESSGVRREHEGSGLGLAIVDRLVDLLGGAIDVESTKGKGTTFEVTFPATRSRENA